MTLRPGSLPWLLRHDTLLNWRRFTDMFARLSRPAALIVGLGTAVGAHALAWPVAAWIGPPRPIAGDMAAVGAVALVCLLAWMTSQGLLGGARALIDRGSLDLLFASPLPAGTVVVSRATAIAASGFGSVAILAMPVVHVGALMHGPAWLAFYPTLAALALLGAAAGLVLAVWLCLTLGARRARLVSQLAAAGIGGGFVLATQVAMLLPDGARDGMARWVADLRAGGDAMLGAFPIARLPLDALGGDILSAVWLLAAAAAVFALAIALLGRPFVRAALATAGSSAHAAASRAADTPVRFRTGVGRAIRRKEWRLMRRDPTVFAQLSLQIIYTVPIAIVLMRSGSGVPLAFALAPAIVVIASQIAASLAWLTVSGEDAPELIAAAPVPRSAIERAKLSAIAIPVVTILALPLAALAVISPPVAAITVLAAAAGAISTSLLNFWHPMPGNRRGMLRRHSQSKLIGLIEHLLALLWAVAAVLALMGIMWAFVPALLASAIVAAFSPARMALATSLDRHSAARRAAGGKAGAMGGPLQPSPH